MKELVLEDLEILTNVLKSNNGKLFVYKNDLSMERLDNLWAAGYLFKSVSWFNKDYVFELTKDGERLVTVKIG